MKKDVDFVGCHKDIFLKKYDILEPAKKGAVLLINSKYDSLEKLENFLPTKLKKEIAEKEIKLYNIDASSIAEK